MNYFTRYKDENLFHIFFADILSVYGMKIEAGHSIFIVKNEINPDSSVQIWRRYLLSKPFDSVHYIEESELDSIQNPIELKEGAYQFEIHELIQFHPKKSLIRFIEKLKSPPEDDRYILLVQRNEDDRFLLDHATGDPIEKILTARKNEFKLPLKVVNFSRLNPQEQERICSGASIMVAMHGAGLTNLIFTPPDCHIIEVNYRRHWYCDPVCDDHYNETLAYNKDCGGPLTFKPDFHKADYHNLSLLLGKNYTEVEAEAYEGYTQAIPICRKRVFVDSNQLIRYINQ